MNLFAITVSINQKNVLIQHVEPHSIAALHLHVQLNCCTISKFFKLQLVRIKWIELIRNLNITIIR
jgi:hypothetical protein